MRTTFRFMSMCVTVACMVFWGMSVTSCSDDDENPSVKLPTLNDIGIDDPVVAIDYANGERIIYNYVDGVLKDGVSRLNGGVDFTFGGTPFTINLFRDYGGGNSYGVTITNVQLNSKGALTYTDYTYSIETDGNMFSYSGWMNAEYDSNNRLSSGYSEQSGVDEGVNFIDRVLFGATWDDSGNLLCRDATSVIDEDGDVNTKVWKTEFLYGEGAQANTGIVPTFMQPTYDVLCYSGMLGAITANIPTAYRTDGGEWKAITLEKDEKGRASKLYVDGELLETYYYADTYVPESNVVKKSPKPANMRRLSDMFNMFDMDNVR